MTSYCATTLAIFFHFILRMSIFLDPGSLSQSNPTHFEAMPSYVNLLSVLLLLNEYQLVPQRYIHRTSTPFCVLIETILSLIIIEIVMIFLWSQLETYIEFEVKKIFKLNALKKWVVVEQTCVTCFTISLSFGVFAIAAWIVELYDKLQKQVAMIYQGITDFFDCSANCV